MLEVSLDSIKRLAVYSEKRFHFASILSGIGGITNVPSGVLITAGIILLPIDLYAAQIGFAFGLAVQIYAFPLYQLGQALRHEKRINFKTEFNIGEKHLIRKWEFSSIEVETIN